MVTLETGISFYANHIHFKEENHTPICCSTLRKIGLIFRDVFAIVVYYLSCKKVDLFSLKAYRTQVAQEYKNRNLLIPKGFCYFSYFGLSIIYKNTVAQRRPSSSENLPNPPRKPSL